MKRIHQNISAVVCALGVAAFSALPSTAQTSSGTDSQSTTTPQLNNQSPGTQNVPSRLRPNTTQSSPSQMGEPGSMQQNPGMQQNPMMQPNSGMQQNGAAAITQQDANFMRLAAQSDMTEIMTSRLALQRSTNPNVRSFAQRMIEHHTMSSNQLMQLAQQKGVTLPKTPNAMGEALMRRLTRLRGAQFDQAYMAGQVQAHTATEAEYRRYLQQNQGGDQDVRAFANQGLPLVAQHRQTATNMTAQRMNTR